MFGKIRLARWLIGAVILAAAECASVAAIEIALTLPAQAQRADDRYPFLSRQRQQGGFFGGLFGGGGFNSRSYPGESRSSNRKLKFSPNPCVRRARTSRMRTRPRPPPPLW